MTAVSCRYSKKKSAELSGLTCDRSVPRSWGLCARVVKTSVNNARASKLGVGDKSVPAGVVVTPEVGTGAVIAVMAGSRVVFTT